MVQEKSDYTKVKVVMCHDGLFRRIHELKESLNLLEATEEENRADARLYWSHRRAIDLVKGAIWDAFLEIEGQSADYTNEEWLDMYKRHQTRSDAQKAGTEKDSTPCHQDYLQD